MSESRVEHISAVATLTDPQRRALFDFVRSSANPVSRDDAATALEVPRSTAAFHLDRLVDEGLLEIEFKRLTGRTGPGSGRPAKLYRAAERELSVSVPPRQYDLAGELLAAAVEQSDRTGRPVRDVLTAVATEAGRDLAARSGGLDAALTSCGYEPQDDGDGGLLLTNCPFHKLATKHSDVICQTNLALLEGVAEASGATDRRVEFVPPTDGHCCVRVVPAKAQDG
ncbi:MAG: transcriptional regulator [Cryobacterium sp.]|nr:transcriptional regulator [Cryobacterium sp.]